MSMKKKTRKNGEKSFSSNEVMSILENMDDGIKIIAEDQSSIKKNVKVMKSDIDNIKDNIVVMKSDIVIIKDDITVMKSDVADIKFELKRKVNYDEFEKLEKRVIRLEKLSFAK